MLDALADAKRQEAEYFRRRKSTSSGSKRKKIRQKDKNRSSHSGGQTQSVSSSPSSDQNNTTTASDHERAEKQYGHLAGNIVITRLQKGSNSNNASSDSNSDHSSSVPLSLQSRVKSDHTEVSVAGISSDVELYDVDIKIGDRLLEVDGKPINTSQDAYVLLKHSSNKVKLTLLRKPSSDLIKSPSMVVENDSSANGLLVIRPTMDRNLDKGSSQRRAATAEPPTAPSELTKSGIDPNVFVIEELKLIRLVRDFNGLGFAIAEKMAGMGIIDRIFIKSLAPGGVAARDGRLKVTDIP